MVPESCLENHGVVLHETFEAQAAIRRDQPAVVFGAQIVTYGELDERANRVAHRLRAKGVLRGSVVAMLLPRSVDAYAAMLGILKAGGAYVPLDPSYPRERLAWMLEDCGASVVVTASEMEGLCRESAQPLPEDGQRATPEDLCYLIYTSGSTGRPKGVMVEHRNVCHLVEAERAIFGVRPEDRVYQGASLSFDLSVEEIWLAFGAGATLVAATPEMASAGPDLSRQLAKSGVTVLSCVPTLLSMLDAEVQMPALRLLIVGGEPCPRELVDRWARPGRRMVNTYGPTETTVISTYADVCPGRPVTIGKPVPGYTIHLLDDRLRPAPRGETGEICIAGAGVARGYRGLPAETQARFFKGPGGERTYRSGDLGRLNVDGDIEFAGRVDGQVKLRGLRVELGEIEAALLRDENVLAAACALRENEHGYFELAGYVVPRSAGGVDPKRLRLQLREWLPAWMVPATIERVGELPRLASGKIDRAALISPHRRLRERKQSSTPANLERALAEVWSEQFGCSEIALHDDFFEDLGGHSLLAARTVSALRKDARFASVTMRDLYSHPTISRLAAVIEQQAMSSKADLEQAGIKEVPKGRHAAAGAIQTVALYFIFGIRGLQWITPWLVFYLVLRHHSAFASAAWGLTTGMAVLPMLIAAAICVKWILLGRIRPGRYSLWGWYHMRWWFVQTMLQSVPLKRLGGTPLLPLVYRAFGVAIGKDVHMSTDLLGAFDVISIGDGATIDEGASLNGYTLEEGDLVIAAVTVGSGCWVGTKAVLCPGAVMEDEARLEDLSLLSGEERLPAGETWAGSPARRIARGKTLGAPPGMSRVDRGAMVALYAVLVLAFPLLELTAFVPGVALLTRFEPAQAIFYAVAPLAGACFMACVALEVAALKWLLLGRARAGRYRVHGWFYVRHWVVEQLLAFSVDVAGPLHSTIFLKPWYRLLGAKLGRFVELSTASVTTPDLLDIEEDCTIADEVSLGAARVEKGWLTLAPTRLGRRTFVGNGAVIPAGSTLGAESLIGVLTVAPADPEQAARRGGSWLGSPPILLSRRQPESGFPTQTTFRPSRKLQWARGFWEIFRITLPGAGFVITTVAVVDSALWLWGLAGPAMTLLLLPAVFAVVCNAVVLGIVPVKWILMGRYKPFERPLWSAFLWRLEFVNALFEFLAGPIGLEALRGTPLLPWYLRLLGCRIGRGVFVDTLGFLEFDLVDIGDGAVLNRDCILQTHLFEDRVMKASGLRIGSGCEIGENSIVLYDSEMKDGARLGALSLLMKSEVLPAGRRWTGSPIDAAGRDNAPEIAAHGMVA